jgi:HSP20 family protein
MANLTPWNPEREFTQMRRLMNRMMQGTMDPFEMMSSTMLPSALASVTPAVEIEDLGTEFRVHCELPGVKEDDVQITVAGNVLTIRGEKRYERSEVKGRVAGQQAKPKQAGAQPGGNGGQEGTSMSERPIFTERSYGMFERIITLPDDVDAAKVDATYKDGVLEIVLARRAESMPRQIPVKIQH